jgi:hypothetical protein
MPNPVLGFLQLRRDRQILKAHVFRAIQNQEGKKNPGNEDDRPGKTFVFNFLRNLRY